VCNEAAFGTLRASLRTLWGGGGKDLESAIERVIAGLERKSRVLSPGEKKAVAYHKAAYSVCGWFLEHALEFSDTFRWLI